MFGTLLVVTLAGESHGFECFLNLVREVLFIVMRAKFSSQGKCNYIHFRFDSTFSSIVKALSRQHYTAYSGFLFC